MDKNLILEILEDWNFWRKDIETGIKRKDYLDLSLRFLKSNMILTIMGVRRSGKSYLIRQLAKELIEKGKEKNEILIVNFEDKRFDEFNLKILDQIYETYLETLKPKIKPFIFLDEIHKVSDWEKWARTIHELNKAKIIVSSSSSKLMSKELATLLTGRHLNINMFPLNFKEFLYFKNIKIENKLDIISKRLEIKGLTNEYLEYGGFPEVVLNEEKKQILLNFFDDIITKDIEKRYEVREAEKLRALARFYLTNISSTITFNSLKNYLGLSTDTIEKFSSYLEEANLIFFLKRFSYKIKEQEKSPRKVYSIDTGLSNAIGFKFSANSGRVMENVVAIELKRRSTINPNLEIYYWKNIQNEEVDFVIKENLKVKQLIQVCSDIKDEKTKKREMRALLKALKQFKLKEGLIISEDISKEEEIDGKKIVYIPLWRWLII